MLLPVCLTFSHQKVLVSKKMKSESDCLVEWAVRLRCYHDQVTETVFHSGINTVFDVVFRLHIIYIHCKFANASTYH